MSFPMSENDFDEIWHVDFEYSQPDGEKPTVKCMVAKEHKSKKVIRLDEEKLRGASCPPFSINEKSLVVAYFASAEMNCFNVLNWEEPTYLLDLFVEFRNLTNGTKVPAGNGLLGALLYFGHDSIEANEKEDMRNLAMRDGPYTMEEMSDLLDYCESDVVSCEKLFNSMIHLIDLPRALYRGEYMKSVSLMEMNGIPLDKDFYLKLIENWSKLKELLIKDVDSKYGVFEGQTFKIEKFKELLSSKNVAWPRTEKGSLQLDDNTFKQMATSYPFLEDLYQLRSTLSQLRSHKLCVSSKDFRNRAMISPYRSVTSRNQPSNSKFIFGFSAWFRSLIMPTPGKAIAYIDWSQQEFGIAASLSGDKNMMESYRSGDPYLSFAILAGAAPKDATKESHGDVRKLFKEAVLAVQYCMGPESLSKRINRSVAEARELLDLHKKIYKIFWAWSDSTLDYAMINKSLKTTLGWTIKVHNGTNPRTLRNFPMQANGAEMLRVALNMLREEGIKILAPVHDAILIESTTDNIKHDVQRTQEIMKRASSVILDGFELETDADVFKNPNRYVDERGSSMWNKVEDLLRSLT